MNLNRPLTYMSLAIMMVMIATTVQANPVSEHRFGRSFTNESIVGGNACEPLSLFSVAIGEAAVILILP